MDCNRDEAVRAMEIAEMKLRNLDFVQARKIAVRAQQLYPNLDNISRLILVCEVHCSAEKKFGGEADWYGILQVQQAADEAVIKKQYRKFALLLHPDKNKLPGAEAAFKLIGEAQRILLDSASRAVHDRKRNASFAGSGLQSVPLNRVNEPFRPPHGTNWYSNVGAPKQSSAQAGFFDCNRAFWTVCPFCSTKYQYWGDIINKLLTCKNCQKAYVGYEANFSRAPQAAFSQQGAFPNESKVDVRSKPIPAPGNKKPVPFSKKRNTTVRSKEVNSGGKRAKKNNSVNDIPLKEVNRGRRMGKKKSSESDTPDSKSSSNSESESTMCAEAESNDNEGRHKCSSAQAVRRSSRQKHSVSYKETRSDDDDTSNPPKRLKGSAESLHAQNGALEEAKLKREDNAGKVPGVLKFAQPEFSDFGKDRRVECFAVGQVWAVYDSNDNFPRSYALIGRVSRAGPKVKVTWFTPDADGVDELNWIKAGSPVAVGNFNLGKDDLIDDFRTFSHKVVWEKGHGKGPHKVYPKLGETWALFKNWDIKWSFDADRKYEYEVVEILCDYHEENGIEVAYLGKLKGFVCLFSRKVGQGRNIFRISSSEMYRFSHRIPSIKLTGSEGENVPSGSFELDPASVPTNLDETILPVVMTPESGTDGCSDEGNSNSSEDSSVPLSEASNGSLVPEPVFFNFDDAKSPGNFKVGQIWSLYSDEDSLPKYYGLITQVTADPTFKIHLSWLASHSLPKGAIRWRDRKMLISSGRFKVDKVDPVCYYSTDAFCHRINTSASQEKDGTWNIIPSKGEVWALYKNWNPGLRSSSLGDCEYYLVEVIGVDESAITVGMLERAGRISCIQRPQTRGPSRVTLQIPLVEILRFSHQVPAFQLTEQKKGILRGFWEFDPLAVPARYFSSKSK